MQINCSPKCFKPTRQFPFPPRAQDREKHFNFPRQQLQSHLNLRPEQTRAQLFTLNSTNLAVASLVNPPPTSGIDRAIVIVVLFFEQFRAAAERRQSRVGASFIRLLAVLQIRWISSRGARDSTPVS